LTRYPTITQNGRQAKASSKRKNKLKRMHEKKKQLGQSAKNTAKLSPRGTLTGGLIASQEGNNNASIDSSPQTPKVLRPI
jgi:hypothetical protein